MSDEQLAAIRARLDRVQEACRMGELSALRTDHHASWEDIEVLLAAVDQMAQDRDYWQRGYEVLGKTLVKLLGVDGGQDKPSGAAVPSNP
jgi:predicted alpha/beta-fold hydrolase